MIATGNSRSFSPPTGSALTHFTMDLTPNFTITSTHSERGSNRQQRRVTGSITIAFAVRALSSCNQRALCFQHCNGKEWIADLYLLPDEMPQVLKCACPCLNKYQDRVFSADRALPATHFGGTWAINKAPVMSPSWLDFPGWGSRCWRWGRAGGWACPGWHSS